MAQRALPKTLVLGVVAAAITAIAGWQWRPDADAETVTPEAAVAAPAAADVPRPRAPTAPLPALDVPLALVVDDLKARAAAGEAPSACRLAVEYSECDALALRRAENARWLGERQRALALLTGSAAKQTAVASIDRELEFRESRIAGLAERCRGVPLPDAAESARHWRRAAMLGSRVAMKQYASGNAFRWSDLMTALPELQTYRAEAERMALTLAREGDIDMLLALAAGYDPTPEASRSLLAQTVNPDLARSLALYRRVATALEGAADVGRPASLRGRVQARIEDLSVGLSGEESARADALTQGELAGWSPPALDGPLPEFANGAQHKASRAACDAQRSSRFNGDGAEVLAGTGMEASARRDPREFP